MTPTERDRIRRILTDALPVDPKWAGWVEGVLDRIAAGADGVTLGREHIPRVVYALRNQDHTSEADWQLAARIEQEDAS